MFADDPTRTGILCAVSLRSPLMVVVWLQGIRIHTSGFLTSTEIFRYRPSLATKARSGSLHFHKMVRFSSLVQSRVQSSYGSSRRGAFSSNCKDSTPTYGSLWFHQMGSIYIWRTQQSGFGSRRAGSTRRQRHGDNASCAFDHLSYNVKW